MMQYDDSERSHPITSQESTLTVKASQHGYQCDVCFKFVERNHYCGPVTGYTTTHTTQHGAKACGSCGSFNSQGARHCFNCRRGFLG